MSRLISPLRPRKARDRTVFVDGRFGANTPPLPGRGGTGIVAVLSSGGIMSLRYFSFPAVLMTVAVLACAAYPARAQDVYTVSGIHVDATAASSGEAYNVAMAQGRPRAWTILFRRLTRQQDWTRQPMLDGGALLRLSRGYTIANERRSTTRYVADVTYIFNPDAVARTLQSAGIAFTQGAPKRILIVPLAPGFSSGPWAQA